MEGPDTCLACVRPSDLRFHTTSSIISDTSIATNTRMAVSDVELSLDEELDADDDRAEGGTGCGDVAWGDLVAVGDVVTVGDVVAVGDVVTVGDVDGEGVLVGSGEGITVARMTPAATGCSSSPMLLVLA